MNAENAEMLMTAEMMINAEMMTQGRYNGRILGKKSEIRPNALFWSEFGGILRSLEKFGGI